MSSSKSNYERVSLDGFVHVKVNPASFFRLKLLSFDIDSYLRLLIHLNDAISAKSYREK